MEGDSASTAATGEASGEASIQVNQLLQLLQNLNPRTQTDSYSNQSINLTAKLNDRNYTVWSRLMSLAIKGRGRLKHIIGPSPNEEASEYQKWQEADSIVITWIIENIEPDLVTQYLDYPTAQELWKGIEATYSSGRDQLQVYDLTVRGYNIKQAGQTIEKFYNTLQTIWKEIDRRMPNPMVCSDDITTHNKLIQQGRLYQFLQGLDDSFDKDRRDLLKEDPLPSVENAYATIRREVARRGIMNREVPSSGVSGEILTGIGIEAGLAAKGRSDSAKGEAKSSLRQGDDKSKLKCSHCGGTRHTKEGCFKLVGYPDWWPDTKKRGNRGTSNVTTTATGSQSTTGFRSHGCG